MEYQYKNISTTLIIAYYLISIGDNKKERKILNQHSIVIKMSKRFAIDLGSEG